MDGLIDTAEALTVTQRAAFAAGILLLAATLIIAATSVAIALWLAVVVVAVACVLFLPVDTDDLLPRPRPAADYAAALERFEADRSSVPLNPLCEPQLLTHGARTPKVVVLLHGVSSCPRAFVDFAPEVFARGHNVLVARMPRNGYADRSTDALRHLTAEELAHYGDSVVDIAAGLGDEVVVLGISAGGTVAAWTAQNRPEVRRAVLVAPFFGLGDLGPRLNLALMRTTLLIPDMSMWKDPRLRERYVGMPHAYQRQSSRATGEIMRLALAVYRQASEGPPAAPEAAVITNAADTAVDNSITAIVADAWEASGMAVERYEFGAEHRLGHELIDPMEPGADPALTYPVILRAIDGALAPAGG